MPDSRCLTSRARWTPSKRCVFAARCRPLQRPVAVCVLLPPPRCAAALRLGAREAPCTFSPSMRPLPIAVQGPEESGIKRAHPAQLAHAARIARAQQVGFTLYGYKVFPDLTPGRAFMWGSILAVYCVGMASYMTARSVGITSVRPACSHRLTAHIAVALDACFLRSSSVTRFSFQGALPCSLCVLHQQHCSAHQARQGSVDSGRMCSQNTETRFRPIHQRGSFSPAQKRRAAVQVDDVKDTLKQHRHTRHRRACPTQTGAAVQVDDVKEKMQAAFAPYREAFEARATTAKASLELHERPAVLASLQDAGRSISRQLGKADAAPVCETAEAVQ